MLEVELGEFRCVFEPWVPTMGRVFRDLFAYDTETTDIIDERPDIVPEFVLGTASDGKRGVFLTRETALPFFEAHVDSSFVCHNASFDLKVTQKLFGNRHDLYLRVENNKVWCSLILKRLLSLATAGHTARGEAGLAECVKVYLGLELDKLVKDFEGRTVRRSFGQFLHQPIAGIPAAYLRYAAGDPMATWHLFWALNEQIKLVLRGEARQAYGYVDDEWLRQVVDRFGPLTHHVQLRASIITDELTQAGIAIDTERVAAKSARISQEIEQCLQQLDARGYRPGQKGNSLVIQNALIAAAAENPSISLVRTASGAKWSTTGEHLETAAAVDPFFEVFLEHRHAQKLQKTYLSKMHRPRIHARFGYLAATGRTYCGGGFNLQNLPKESVPPEAEPTSPSIRSAFVPATGNVFIDSDLGQIELVVLAYIWKHQLGLGDALYSLVNTGQDVHRLIASAVMNKPLDQITKADRNSAKPVSFGRPGGMSGQSLQRIAHLNYGLDLSLNEVNERIEAYHRLCPELNGFLADEVPSALILAQHLNLTPCDYANARGDFERSSRGDDSQPAEWLAQMLLKVVAERCPITNKGAGRPYTPEEIEYFWSKATSLADELSPPRARDLRQRLPSKELANEVRNWAGRRSVITVTGRLRANATFCASRNTLFQGAAADGAVFGLWRIWRAGYQLKAFIHDQVVIEAAADEHVHEHVAIIEQHMKDGILEIVPGMTVKVETSITKSLDKNDVDDRYCR